MLTKNKGTVGGTVMDTFFGCRLLNFGVFSETLVTMALKIVIWRHTRCRGGEKRPKERHQVRRPVPPPPSRIGFVWKHAERRKVASRVNGVPLFSISRVTKTIENVRNADEK